MKTIIETSPSVPLTGQAVHPRLLSIDALRGFTMFWIIGADQLVHALAQFNSSGAIQILRDQMTHKEWEGFAFYDLIFPMFVFLVGVSLVFSLGKILETEGRAGAYKRIFRRTLLLFLFGILYSGGISQGWPDIRLMGVLQRIALAYLFAGLIFCHFGWRGMLGICAGLLAGYWAILTFIPVPGLGEVSFAERQNIANYIDQLYLPGSKYYGSYDPEGLLSTLPAIASCLLGVFAGMFIKNVSYPNSLKPLALVGSGLVLLAAGYGWGLQFPIIKKIWTSSYVLVAAGWSALFLALFFHLIENLNWRRWTTPFVWIGLNPITIYIAYNVVDFPALARRFVGGNIHQAAGQGGDLLVFAVTIGLVFLLAWFLDRKKIYLRV